MKLIVLILIRCLVRDVMPYVTSLEAYVLYLVFWRTDFYLYQITIYLIKRTL